MSAATRGTGRTVDVRLGTGWDDALVGRAFFTSARGRVSTMFRYNDEYLRTKGAFPLEPALPLFAGAHAVADGLPCSFTDCSPDRWGRNLIKKRRHALDAEAGRTRSEVTEIDFLLGVTDMTRQGALRFTDPDAGSGGPFLATDVHVPKLIELPRLLAAADKVVRDDDDTAIKELLDAGTGSLGGARPKASVLDGERILIAKFASPSDEWDVIAWEKTTLDLAERAGIMVPRRRLERVSGRSVLLLDRFDRTAVGTRIPYLSAMTLLGARDGESSGFDYVDVAEAFAEHGATTVRSDLVELWRRAVFSVAVNNTDDHLRNHGFLRGSAGWTPSPAFDINPSPDTGTQRQLGIGAAHARADTLTGLHGIAPDFGVDAPTADRILRDVFTATCGWRSCATMNGVPEHELALMADAFDGLRDQVA
jgi:serine/threonine-protein kinase HipA